jgi:hypothetical protein
MIVEVVAKGGPCATLAAFHDLLCRTCGLNTGQRRESDNVAGGFYHLTNTLGIEIRTEEWDSSDLAGYEYCARFKATRDTVGSAILEGVADLVAMELAALGLDVLRVSTTFAGAETRRVVRRCLVSPGAPPTWTEA